MRATLAAPLLAALLLAAPGVGGQGRGRAAELEVALARLAERGLVYEQTALRFACREQVTITAYNSQETIKKQTLAFHDYLMEYTEEEGLQPYRAILARDGRPASRKQVSPDYGVPEPYAWNLLFTPDRQGRFEFSLVDKAMVGLRPALVIEFRPLLSFTDGTSVDQWEGKAWVDEDSGDVLQVEAVPAHQGELLGARLAEYRQGFRFLGMSTRKRPRIRRLSVEFGHEREGLRFPSRSFASTRLVGPDGGERLDSSVAQVYEEYVFFGIESREEFDERRAPRP